MSNPDLSSATWRKSSRSATQEGGCVEVARATWRKSSHSGANEGNCVEIATALRLVAVRDSKDPAGPVLAFARTEWRGLVTGIKTGAYDLTTT